MKKLLLIALLVFASGEAQAQVIRGYVGKHYKGENIHLNLNQILNLRSRAYGKLLKSVIIKARTRGGNGRAWIYLDGYQSSNYRVIGTSLLNTTLRPTVPRRIGRDFYSATVRLYGDFYVESVAVEVARSGGGFVEKIRKHHNREINDHGTIKVRAYLDLDEKYNGRTLKAVRLRVRSVQHGPVLVQLLLTGREVVKGYLNHRTKELVLRPRYQAVLNSSMSVQLVVTGGSIHTDELGVDLF